MIQNTPFSNICLKTCKVLSISTQDIFETDKLHSESGILKWNLSSL